MTQSHDLPDLIEQFGLGVKHDPFHRAVWKVEISIALALLTPWISSHIVPFNTYDLTRN
jgi:hypothetical protein